MSQIARPTLTLLSLEQIQRVHEAALKVLENTGLLVEVGSGRDRYMRKVPAAY